GALGRPGGTLGRPAGTLGRAIDNPRRPAGTLGRPGGTLRRPAGTLGGTGGAVAGPATGAVRPLDRPIGPGTVGRCPGGVVRGGRGPHRHGEGVVGGLTVRHGRRVGAVVAAVPAGSLVAGPGTGQPTPDPQPTVARHRPPHRTPPPGTVSRPASGWRRPTDMVMG